MFIDFQLKALTKIPKLRILSYRDSYRCGTKHKRYCLGSV